MLFLLVSEVSIRTVHSSNLLCFLYIRKHCLWQIEPLFCIGITEAYNPHRKVSASLLHLVCFWSTIEVPIDKLFVSSPLPLLWPPALQPVLSDSLSFGLRFNQTAFASYLGQVAPYSRLNFIMR